MRSANETLNQLARLIEEISGNVVPEGHFPFLKEIAAHRARANGLPDVSAYVAAMSRGGLSDEWSRLLPLITVNESYFFRSTQQFRALRNDVLPLLARVRAEQRSLRVWSAGCARGEEPATLAIVLQEMDALAGWDWRITATDVDEAALADARAGIYSARAVNRVPTELMERYFHRQGDLYLLSRHLLARIDYRALNLIREPFPPPATPFDLILLRNVLIYFRPASQRRVVANMAAALAPDGFLFLGPSETLWQLSDAFEPLDLGDCFCYRPRYNPSPGDPKAGTVPRPGPPRSERPPVTRAPRPQPPRRTLGQRPVAPPDKAAADVDHQTEAPVSSTARRVQELAALVAANRLEEAGEAAREALLISPTDPVLRSLEGLIQDLTGRAEEAAAAYRAALFLDPLLVQTRLLLADALRRMGWDGRARHEYREVLGVLDTGRGRDLPLAGLDLPSRAAVETRCRRALERG